MRNRFAIGLAGLCSAGVLPMVVASNNPYNPQLDCANNCNFAVAGQRQINITGATLFRAFFEAPSSTNDFIDVDRNGCAQFGQPGCFPNNVDQLAAPNNFADTWLVQYRGTGSLRGFEEFTDFQLCCDLPENFPTERSNINHVLYFDATNPVNFPNLCATDVDGNEGVDATATPVCHTSMDLAIVDVPSVWVVLQPGSPNWDRKPQQPGYGVNFGQSSPLAPSCPAPGPFPYGLETASRDCDGNGTIDITANFNTSNPDNLTFFDNSPAFVAVVPIVNRGVGRSTFSVTDLRYLNVTGRMPNGENLNAGSRDDESGTRNAWLNSLGIDPARGVADNLGGRTTSAAQMNLGPCHRVTNGGSSSHTEQGVQMNRLGIAYTGISGSTAAAADAIAGLYEVANVINDTKGGTQPVRPGVTSILKNCDPDTGYQIGGYVTFVSRGNRNQTNPAAPDYMCNQAAADYLRNIFASVAAITPPTDPNQITDPNNNLSPGQFLARSFFLTSAQDCAQQFLTDPELFTTTPPANFSQALQDFVIANNNLDTTAAPNGVVTPPFGSVNVAGKVPARSQGAYSIWNGAAFVNVAAGVNLSRRNQVAGDTNFDKARNWNDIPSLIVSFNDPNAFQQASLDPTSAGFNLGGLAADVYVPEISNDFNGDGLFDRADIRLFADGLALNPADGRLNRAEGFTRVDVAAGNVNFFNTVINSAGGAVCGIAWQNGWSRFDVTGANPRPGSFILGADGFVTVADLEYIIDNFGDWSDLDQAQGIDLSADMTGDLRVDWCDVRAFQTAFGASCGYDTYLQNNYANCQADLDGDGAVTDSDLGLLLSNFGAASGQSFGNGDVDCDGDVDDSDLGILLSAFGGTCNL